MGRAFGDWLTRSNTLKAATVRAYLGALGRLVDERGTSTPMDAPRVAAFLESHLSDMRAGRIGSKSDKVYGSPAIGRMRKWLASDAADASPGVSGPGS